MRSTAAPECGLPKKRTAAQPGLDPNTVRRYLEVAATAGVSLGDGVTEEHVRAVLLALHPGGGRPRGDGWARCVEQHAANARWPGEGLGLTNIRKLLVRHGIEIPYATLHRYAALELQFGKTATTMPVLDGEARHELQVDTGWVGTLACRSDQADDFARGSATPAGPSCCPGRRRIPAW